MRLYFIALLPPEDLQAEITAFKQYTAGHFGSRHALRSPPHLTLAPPFRWPAERESDLRQALHDFDFGPPLHIKLHNFNRFGRRVIFVDVLANPGMSRLHDRLRTFLHDRLQLISKSGHGFNPHVTIAHRDLSPAQFDLAWSYFSRVDFQAEFAVTTLTLLRHQDWGWEVVGREGAEEKPI